MRFFKKKDEPRPETVARVKEIAREPVHNGYSQVVGGLGENTAASTMELFPIKTKEEAEEEKWEQRRWELARYLVAQDRRSVVLGKLNMSDMAIARKARQLTDATINELRKYNKSDSNGDQE